MARTDRIERIPGVDADAASAFDIEEVPDIVNDEEIDEADDERA